MTVLHPLECVHCGNTMFKKTSTISCSSIPPFFKCASCGKFQPGSINFALSPITGWSIRTKDDLFVRHLQCRECDSMILKFDPDSLPDGWQIEMEEMKDPLGNPMMKRYAYCGIHSPVVEDWMLMGGELNE